MHVNMKKSSLLVLMIAAAGVSAQELDHPRDMNLQQQTFRMPDTASARIFLENGLNAFIIEDRRAPVVSFTMYVRGGTGDDRVQGAAEMLALMLATRGPCWMAPGRFQETIDEMGAEFVVTMDSEFTEVNLNVAAEDARRALRIFSGIVREPCIDPQGLDSFRAAVVRSNQAATPSEGQYEGSLDKAVDLFYERLFGAHPYGHAVTSAEAEALSVEDVERFYNEHVSPLNISIAVAGDFDVSEMLRNVDQRFADWQQQRPPTFHKVEPLAEADRLGVYGFPADKLQTWIVIGHGLPPVDPADRPALEVMNYILGGGHFDTRLFREARDRRGLTNDASGILDFNLRGPGAYTFRTYGRPEVAQELIDIVVGEIARMQNDLVTQEELFVARGALADGVFAMRFENGHIAARTFAREWARYGTFVHLAEYQERIRKVSAEDVQDAARRYLDPSRLLIVTLGPTAG